MTYNVLLGMGSNLGDKREYLRTGLAMLAQKAGTIESVSAIYESEPWGVKGQESYYNLAVMLKTERLPLELLDVVQKIEDECGRKRQERWGSRTLDIDLLLYENYIFTMPDLVVPHPRLTERNFVLWPLAEIAPDLVHPQKRLKVVELKESCPDTGWIKPCGYF